MQHLNISITMEDFKDWTDKLQSRLARPLPGLEYQLKLATMNRKIRNGIMEVPPDAKKSAVLVLFYPAEGDLCLAFIKRPEYPGVHSGQVSFPGGGAEPGDKDLVQTALREAFEEIGVPAARVSVLGQLTDLYIPPSNFLVAPIVGYLDFRPDFVPDPEEVDHIIEVPLSELTSPGCLTEKEIVIFPDVRLKVPCYYAQENVIWGATAMMLSELLETIRTIS